MKVSKIMAFTIIVLFLAVMLVGPVNASKPTIVDENVWFVWSLTTGATTGNEAFWTGDGTILHNDATYGWNLMRSPTPTNRIQIGTVVSNVKFMFDTTKGEGNVIIKATMTFTEADKVKNPYGVGTIECTAVAKLTSLNSVFALVPGDGVGFIVGTKGTEDFENAKLTADLVLGSIPGTEGIFFGTHTRVNGAGSIVYHNPGV